MKRIIFNILVIITIIFVSCTKNNDYIINNGLHPDDIIKFTSITPLSGYADSSSQIIIRVSINSNTDSVQIITLSTNKGIINGKSNSETSSVNLDRYIDFILTTGQVFGPVLLRASVGGYSRDTIINFLKAYPDSLIVTPASSTAPKNTDVLVYIDLFRINGFPSNNQTFLYSAIDAAGNVVGTLTPMEKFNPGNILNAKFTPDIDFTGNVVLQVFDVKEDGSKLKGTSKIIIQ